MRIQPISRGGRVLASAMVPAVIAEEEDEDKRCLKPTCGAGGAAGRAPVPAGWVSLLCFPRAGLCLVLYSKWSFPSHLASSFPSEGRAVCCWLR